MANNNQKLELTWIGKGEQPKLEPRILIEDPEKSYGDPNSQNMLIHGDNLLALKALEQDYAGKIKCIYIDPPYNTGNAFEHYDDNLEHSIWLTLIIPRLELLKSLLSDDGIIWISIDDYECHYLRVLCDEVFGRSNFVACLPTIMNLKGNQDQFGFAGTHEYTLVYCKNKSKCTFNEFKVNSEDLEDWGIDDIGYFKKGAPLRATGEEGQRENRPYMFYPILIKENKAHTIDEIEFKQIYDKNSETFNDEYLSNLLSKYESEGYETVLPIVDKNNYGRWRWGYNPENISRLEYDVIISRTKNGISLYKKQRPEINELPSKKPKTLFYKPEYSSGNGTSQIKKLFGSNTFSYPKPEDLIKDFIILSTNTNDIVLDSFLGSGTTSAVAHKMGRRWIGIELGNHCDTHCLPRLKKVVDGTDQGGISKAVEWKGGGGFKYYYLAPSLLKKDNYGNWVIEPQYNAEMLAAAMTKHEGFRFEPNETVFWKQGKSTEKDFIYTTTSFITVEMLDKIQEEMLPEESLLICCKAFQEACTDRFSNITIKKIPNMLLGKCEFGKEDYSLNIINVPMEKKEPEIDEIEIEEEKPESKFKEGSLFDTGVE